MRDYPKRQDRYYPPPILPPVRTERNCMRCKKPFMSEGAHNRMCAQCRSDSGPKEYKLCL